MRNLQIKIPFLITIFIGLLLANLAFFIKPVPSGKLSQSNTQISGGLRECENYKNRKPDSFYEMVKSDVIDQQLIEIWGNRINSLPESDITDSIANLHTKGSLLIEKLIDFLLCQCWSPEDIEAMEDEFIFKLEDLLGDIEHHFTMTNPPVVAISARALRTRLTSWHIKLSTGKRLLDIAGPQTCERTRQNPF